MENFEEAYKEIMDCIPVPDICIEEMPEESRIKRAWTYRRKRYMTAAALAGGIFVIYTLGGVAAAGYARSLVRGNENSVQTMDMNTALIQEESAMLQVPAETYGEIGRAYTEEDYEETAGSGIEGRLAEPEASVAYSDGVAVEALENSVEQKMQSALPEEGLEEAWKQADYILEEDGSWLVRLETEEKVLLLHQYHDSDISDLAFAKTDLDGGCNERNYTTGQGFVYKLADSPDGEEIYAAITVGDYELILEFYGYMETEVCEVLESMDLTVYQ